MVRAMVVVAAAVLGGCTTTNETNPARSAAEELLISGAADRAAAKLDLAIPKGTAVYIDASKFDATTFDGKYALGQIEDQLVRQGVRPVPERKDADMVVQVRVGALSIDDEQFLIGIPRYTLPIPFAGSFVTPEIALYKKRTRSGIAKFAATAYGTGKNAVSSSVGPKYGIANEREWTVLLFFSWAKNDVAPEEKESGLRISAPTTPLTPQPRGVPGEVPTSRPNSFSGPVQNATPGG